MSNNVNKKVILKDKITNYLKTRKRNEKFETEFI